MIKKLKLKPAVMTAFRCPRDLLGKVNEKAKRTRGGKSGVIVAALRKGLK